MTTWISHPQAAAILGVGTTTVQRLIARGDLSPRKAAPRNPSLNKAEVQALARRLRREAAARARQAAQRKAPAYPPPPGEYEWLTVGQAAHVLGITVPAIAKRVDRGTIPFVTHRGRRWFRADHMELLRRARDARAVGEVADVPGYTGALAPVGPVPAIAHTS